MALWAEIWNGAQTQLFGLADLASAAIIQKMDGAGSMTLDFPATGAHVGLLRWGRWAVAYTDRPRRRKIGQGVLMRQGVSISAGQPAISWKCTDSLVALQRTNVLLNRVYDNTSLPRAIRELIGLVPGWSVKLDGVAGSISKRFDGESVLEALNILVELTGFHFRQGETDRQLIFGELGESSGIRLVQVTTPERVLRTNPHVALIETLEVQEDGADVVNWLMPYSGPVDGALTLRRSTRTEPYVITPVTGPAGQSLYVLRDETAIAEDGEIQHPVSPRDLVFPVSADTAGVVNAANVLYDWAAVYLQRHRKPQINYRATVAKLDSGMLAGRKVRLVYNGNAAERNERLQAVRVDEDFWVTQHTRRYSLSGVADDLELSNNSEPPRKPEAMLAQLLKKGKVAAQMSVNQRSTRDTLSFAGYGDSQAITFEVRDEAIYVSACLVTLTRAQLTGPDRLRLVVDGAEVPGGPFFEGATSGLTLTVDIGDTIFGLASIKGEHTLTITALYGSGDLDVNVTVYEAVVGLN